MAVTLGPRRVFHPRWPCRTDVVPERVAVTYDRLSDTLFVDLFGASRPAVSVQTGIRGSEADCYLRLDAVSEDVVGVQIEGVRVAAHRPPWLDDALTLAAAPGPAAIASGAPSHTRTDQRKRALVDALFDALSPVPV